jgi:hypothetical protein
MSRWVHLATAPDQLTAEMWVSILRDAGLSAMIRPSDAVSFLGVSAYGCRVQVLEEDLQEAQEMLAGEIDSVSEDD